MIRNAGDASLSRTYAAQLIGLMPDVILAGSTINLAVIVQATSRLLKKSPDKLLRI